MGYIERATAGWYADPFHRFEVRYWDGKIWTQQVATAGVLSEDSPQGNPIPSAYRLSFVDLCIGAGLVLWSTATWLVLIATSRFADPFKSQFYGVSWLVLPAAAAVAGYLRGEWARPFVWAFCSAIPGVVVVALVGTVFYDSTLGVSFWPVGEVFVLIQGGLACVAAFASAAVRRRR